MEATQVYCRNQTDPVILVDDNGIDLDLASRLYGYSSLPNPLVTFLSNRELQAYLDKVEREEEPFPAMVFLDVNMPRENGFVALEGLRARKPLREEPPVIMFTNSDNPKDRVMALEKGASSYLLKQYEFDYFVPLLDSLRCRVERGTRS